jgi:hypothetical protein
MTDQPGASQPPINLPDPGQGGPQLALMLEPDLKSMHLRIGRDGKLMAGIVFSADQLDGLISNLVQTRERMPHAPPVKQALAEAAPAEAGPTEFSPGIAHEIKGVRYDFAISDSGQQLIFSVRDESLGWLSFRFDAPLLERMLNVVNTAKRLKT